MQHPSNISMEDLDESMDSTVPNQAAQAWQKLYKKNKEELEVLKQDFNKSESTVNRIIKVKDNLVNAVVSSLACSLSREARQILASILFETDSEKHSTYMASSSLLKTVAQDSNTIADKYEHELKELRLELENSKKELENVKIHSTKGNAPVFDGRQKIDLENEISDLKEELKDLKQGENTEISLLKREISKLKEQQKSEGEDYIRIKWGEKNQTGELEKQRNDFAKLFEESETLKKYKDKLTERIEELNDQITDWKEKTQKMSQSLSMMSKAEGEMKSEIENLRSKSAKKDLEINNLTQINSSMKATLSKEQKVIQEKLEAKINDLKKSLEDFEKNEAKLNADKQKMKNEMQILAKSEASLKFELANETKILKLSIGSLKKEKEDCEKKFKETEERANSLSAKIKILIRNNEAAKLALKGASESVPPSSEAEMRQESIQIPEYETEKQKEEYEKVIKQLEKSLSASESKCAELQRNLGIDFESIEKVDEALIPPVNIEQCLHESGHEKLDYVMKNIETILNEIKPKAGAFRKCSMLKYQIENWLDKKAVE